MDNDLCLSEWIWLHIVLDVIMDNGTLAIVVVVVVVRYIGDRHKHFFSNSKFKYVNIIKTRQLHFNYKL